MTISIRAYHGTLASRVDSIRSSGIYPSDNPDDWLGEGTYFFVDGLDDPWTSASQWARCKGWDKAHQEFSERSVAVIEVMISADESTTFDLRDHASMKEFHRARRKWLKSLVPRGSTHRTRPEATTFDTDFVDLFKQQKGIAVLLGDFHIQFSLRERHFRLESRIPNVSMLCLSNPAPNVDVAITEITITPAASFLESEVE